MPEVKLQTVTKSEVGKEIRDFQHIIEKTVPDKSPNQEFVAQDLPQETAANIRSDLPFLHY